MKTVKVRLVNVVDHELTLEYETEAVVNDEEGWQDGHAAGRILNEFQRGVLAGYMEAAGEAESA